MEKFYKASRAIILFLILMLVVNTCFSDRATQRTAILILISMLLINADTMANFLNNATKVFDVNTPTAKESVSTVHTDSNGIKHGGGGKSF